MWRGIGVSSRLLFRLCFCRKSTGGASASSPLSRHHAPEFWRFAVPDMYARASATLAAYAIVVDARNDRAAAYYGVLAFTGTRRRLFLPLETFEKLIL
jgi:hypothetical protein